MATGCLLDNLASSPIHPGNGSIYLFYQVLSFENDPWAGLRRILAVACATTNKHLCVQRPVCVGRLRSPIARHTANTTKSQLLLLASLRITRLNLPSLVPQYTTALYNLKMANDGVEPGTSTTAFMRTFPMPTPHVNCQLSSVILRVFSIVRRGNWVGSVALDLICGRAY